MRPPASQLRFRELLRPAFGKGSRIGSDAVAENSILPIDFEVGKGRCKGQGIAMICSRGKVDNKDLSKLRRDISQYTISGR